MLTRIHNTSLISAYFGLDSQCKCLEYLFMGDQKLIISSWSRLHLQSLASTNPDWARVVGYPQDLCPSSGDINRLMMISKASVCNVSEDGNVQTCVLPLVLYHKYLLDWWRKSYRLNDYQTSTRRVAWLSQKYGNYCYLLARAEHVPSRKALQLIFLGTYNAISVIHLWKPSEKDSKV
jgi:hypothetical protein